MPNFRSNLFVRWIIRRMKSDLVDPPDSILLREYDDLNGQKEDL